VAGAVNKLPAVSCRQSVKKHFKIIEEPQEGFLFFGVDPLNPAKPGEADLEVKEMVSGDTVMIGRDKN